MKKIVVIFLFIFAFSSFRLANDVSDGVKYKMFCCACGKAWSTYHDYVVVKVKNLKTGELKDLCTTPNMLSGAMWHETGKLRFGFDYKQHPTRYFEFSKDSALLNIRFNDYSSQELTAFQNQLNVDSIIKQIKAGKLRSVNFGKNERYFAHIMFNLGVVTTSGCFGTRVSYFNGNCKE